MDKSGEIQSHTYGREEKYIKKVGQCSKSHVNLHPATDSFIPVMWDEGHRGSGKTDQTLKETRLSDREKEEKTNWALLKSKVAIFSLVYP